MKIAILLIFCIPFSLNSQIKFKPASNLLNPVEHFSGSVIGVADMNGDALDDIIRLQSARRLSIEYQTAPGAPFKHRYLGEIAFYEFWNVSIADINQDGYNDMAFAANENVGYIYYSQKAGDTINYQVQALNGSQQAYAQAGNLVDINNDGWLDYFLCNDLGANKIWANDGLGRLPGSPVEWIDFKTVPTSDNSGNYGSVWSDLDNDGDLDLYIAKCKAGAKEPTDPRRINTFFKNNGGTYIESALSAGIAIGDQSWIAISGDSDNDGDLDLFIINHFTPSKLMINDGHGNFKDGYGESGINYNAIGVQAAWVDLDNDGWLDLIISGSAHQVYRNKGQNKFELINSPDLGLAQFESFSIGDLNQDGKQDIYSTYSLLFNEASHRPDVLWLNQSANANHFLKVRLNGVQANKSAIGAKITLVAGGMRQTREIYAGQSYGISASLTQHFGLGALTKIDTLVVRWPNGMIERIEAPFIDRTLVIKQNTCFGFDPVIASAPTKNVLCNASDSVVLTVPLSGDILWSNGQTSRSIIVRNPGNFQARVKTTTGCELYSNIIAIEKDQRIQYPVIISDSVICDGSVAKVSLSQNKFIQWNTGDTGQTIQVKSSGKYYATVVNECSQSNSDTVSLRLIKVLPLVVKNDTVSLSGKAILTAQGNSVSWYTAMEGGSPIATGNSYKTPSLEKTTTYYAQSALTTKGLSFKGGITAFVSPSKLHANNFSGKLFFDALQDFLLKSVKVYTDTAGLREIDLLDASGKILESKLIKIEKGESRVMLDFSVPKGLGMSLATNEDASVKIFGIKSPLLYRTEGTVSYPLVSGPLAIYGTNAGPTNYYYFYDWDMAYPDLICSGPRVPVQGVVRTVGVQNSLQGLIKVYPNPVGQRMYVDISELSDQIPISIKLMNSIGQVKYASMSNRFQKVTVINTLHEPSGIYFLRIEQGSKTGTVKVLISK